MTQHAEASNHGSLPAAPTWLNFTCDGIRYHCTGDWPEDPELTMPELEAGSGWPWLHQVQWFVQLKNFQQHNRVQPQRAYLLLRILQGPNLVAVLPLMSSDSHRTLCALSNYYSPEFKPLEPVNAGRGRDQLWPILLAAISTLWPSWQQLQLQPLAIGTAGQIHQSCPARIAASPSHYGYNWRTLATSNTDYWQKRQSPLLNTIRRKKKKLLQLGVEIQIHRQLTPELVAAYWHIYQRSWKQAEPSADFINWLLQFASQQGQLRLGLLRIDGAAVAFQFWLVQQHQAAIVKLAQDQAFDALSPGTVLMAAMIDEVMIRDGVTELDFLTGNDDYKAQWMDQCLPLLQLDLHNCQHLAGRLCFLKHKIGRWLSALTQLWPERHQTASQPQRRQSLRQPDD